MLTDTREPYPCLRVPATREKWAATSAAPGVARMSCIARSCRLMHQVDPNEKTIAWLILAATRTSMAETDPVALCKGTSAAALDPWRRRAGVWAAGRGGRGAPASVGGRMRGARGSERRLSDSSRPPRGPRPCLPAPRRPRMRGGRRRHAGAASGANAGHIPRAAARGRAPPAAPLRRKSPTSSGRRRSRRPAAALHGASLAECTGTMRPPQASRRASGHRTCRRGSCDSIPANALPPPRRPQYSSLRRPAVPWRPVRR